MGTKHYKIIDKAIYSVSPEIGRRYSNPLWWIITSLSGAALLLLHMSVPALRSNAIVSAIVLTVAFCALFAALTAILYYLAGDCKRPVHKPSGKELVRKESYYDHKGAARLLECLTGGNVKEIASIPTFHQPLYMYVTYSTESGDFMCAQLVDATAVFPKGVTETKILAQKK